MNEEIKVVEKGPEMPNNGFAKGFGAGAAAGVAGVYLVRAIVKGAGMIKATIDARKELDDMIDDDPAVMELVKD